MRVHGIAVFLEDLVHRLHGFVLARVGGEEILLQKPELRARYLVAPPFGKRLHSLRRKRRVAAADLKQQTLEVGGDEDIHGRGHGAVKRPFGVVNALCEKFGKYAVAVGRANQFTNGQAHLFRVPARENVPEIARRH